MKWLIHFNRKMKLRKGNTQMELFFNDLFDVNMYIFIKVKSQYI